MMAIKIYNGSGTNEITFVAAGSTDNVLQVRTTWLLVNIVTAMT